ncbi:MAG TPA: alpha/beta hydrolase [Gemmatimonadales bacterium]|nr:alpha/beta hydrolase [Gemmatimonadales bacterium]
MLAALVALSACRATPLPRARVYPAGTALETHYVRVDGTNVRYVDTGRGTPVIFLHGFGASIYVWRDILEPVAAAGFRALAFDNRGFGLSDKPANGYGNADYAHLLGAFMDSLGIPDAVIVGHSMGGAIAAEFALAHPSRVRGLVLMDAAGFGVRIPFALRVVGWPGVGRIASALRGRWITARLLRSTYALPARVSEADVDQYYAPVADPDFGRALRGVLADFRFDALRGRLSAVAEPTLVLWGEQDRLIPLWVGRAVALELPRAALVPVPKTGHALPEEAPAEVARLLIAFLQKGVPGPPPDLAIATTGR